MKKLMYTLAIVLTTATFSFAQTREGRNREDQHRPEGRPERPERMSAAMQEKLALTADQKKKVEAIELDQKKKHEEWRKKDEDFRQTRMKERKAYMDAQKQKMDKVLTDEQRSKLVTFHKEEAKKFRDQREDRKKQGRPGERKAPRPSKKEKP